MNSNSKIHWEGVHYIIISIETIIYVKYQTTYLYKTTYLSTSKGCFSYVGMYCIKSCEKILEPTYPGHKLQSNCFSINNWYIKLSDKFQKRKCCIKYIFLPFTNETQSRTNILHSMVINFYIQTYLNLRFVAKSLNVLCNWVGMLMKSSWTYFCQQFSLIKPSLTRTAKFFISNIEYKLGSF